MAIRNNGYRVDIMEENHEIEEEYNKFPAWIWVVISGVFIWAFIFAPFNLLNP